MAEKSFKDHFTYSMRAAGIPETAIPSAMFDTATGATAAIATWAEAAKMLGARATLGELIAVVTTGGVGTSGAGMVALGTVKATGAVLAAYWLGCVIGAVLYAVQMTTIGDSWLDKLSAVNAPKLMHVAESYGVQMPPLMAQEFQIALVTKEELASSPASA